MMFKSLFLFITSLLLPTQILASPQWIEHASIPGPDTAAAGLSRFDQLFIRADGEYQIPYPFEKLGKYLEARLDNGDENGLRRVFIPLGRSLQRNTAAPGYFKFPREVIALEGEPVTSARDAGQVLEYRLFIAHQPSTATLEVISYNNRAARFEFQVVENYAPDQSPRVRQANRVMCLSCHQNAGPIFPQTPWSETSFNIAVAKQLISALPQRFDSLIGIVTNDAGIIDVLAERANYLSVAQYIWRKGCSSSRCRVALLRAILQFRLSGESSFESKHDSYQIDYYARLQRNWKHKWPQGLALAGSRLVTLDPFDNNLRTLAQDPLSDRPAQAIWYQVDPIFAAGIVYRLAGFFTRDDIMRFDRRLIELDRSAPGLRQQFRVPCRVAAKRDSTLELFCAGSDSSNNLQASFEIEQVQDEVESVRIIRLTFPGDANIWQPEINELKLRGTTIQLQLSSANAELSQRLGSGNRIHSASIILGSNPTSPFSDSIFQIEIADDFRHIDKALMTLVEDNAEHKSDSLSAQPFRRRPIVEDLMRQLGMPSLNWLQVSKPSEAAKEYPRAMLKGGLALLYSYCGQCHGDDSVNPPGFLFGQSPEKNLLQCAPRILTRLKAWKVQFDFPRSPMPPPASPGFSGTSIANWPASDQYSQLLNSIQNLIDNNYPDNKAVNWPDTDYAELPPCLASN